MKTIIIGDIHGCYREWKTLLNKVKLDVAEDQLILLGDMMDRGECSCETLMYVKELKDLMGERMVILRGNHEDMLFRSLNSYSDSALWRQNGRRQTIKSFCRNNDRFQNHVGWLRKNTVDYYREGHFQCVHAGLTREDPREEKKEDIYWNREPLMTNAYGGRLTIVGHTPLEQAAWFDGRGGAPVPLEENKWRTLPEKGMIGLDTGCVFGGKLTAMLIRGREYCIISTEKRKNTDALQPEEI